MSKRPNSIASLAAVIAALIVSMSSGSAQTVNDPRLVGYLKTLFRDATDFLPKSGNPPHFTAMKSGTQPENKSIAGYAFWTTELAPFERGYDGPIKMLVGLDTTGRLTGVVVVEHREPYGNISVDRPEFAAQFKGKSVRDGFVVGQDVDAVSRATITVTSAARALKVSSRLVAKQLLTPPDRVQ